VYGAKHHSHGGGEVLTVARLAFKQEVRQRIGDPFPEQIGGVREIGAEVVLEHTSAGICCSTRIERTGQFDDPAIYFRKE
jgi:hypothetical protein